MMFLASRLPFSSSITGWGKVFAQGLDLSEEELRRRNYLVLCLLIMIPSIFGLTLVDVVEGLWPDALRGTAVGTLATLLLFAVARRRGVWWFVRATILSGLAVVFYETATGGSDGLAFLWLYTLPLIVFFLFGKKEGSLWMLGILVILSLLFFGELSSHSYSPWLRSRFLVTYLLLSLIAGFLEVSRQRYYEALLVETTAVEEALEQVKRLQGMLRICASCKRIRDDRGYWSQIEAYLEQHSEAEFSYALCPDCRGQGDGLSALERSG